MTPLITLSAVRRAAILCGLSIGAAFPAFADDDRRMPRIPNLPKYQQECAACHIAYPPGMLPAASWQRLMGGLDRHFGTDASLDAESVKQISAWLQTHAGTHRRVKEVPPEDRITRSAWFVRKHDEVPAAAWKHPKVKTASNCAACHVQADQGVFNEHDVRIPR